MATATLHTKIIPQQKNNIEQLKKKAAFWDEFMEFMEDKFFGNLMELTEKEKNLSLSKAKKLLR
ncbi:MAG: hypothetical protein WC587_03795 [Candidatus Paceibacterota bacterium]